MKGIRIYCSRDHERLSINWRSHWPHESTIMTALPLPLYDGDSVKDLMYVNMALAISIYKLVSLEAQCHVCRRSHDSELRQTMLRLGNAAESTSPRFNSSMAQSMKADWSPQSASKIA